MSDRINMKTIKHRYGTTVWLCPTGFQPIQNETHGFWFTNAPWAILVSKQGIAFEEDARLKKPTAFDHDQFVTAFGIAHEIWKDEFYSENAEDERGD